MKTLEMIETTSHTTDTLTCERDYLNAVNDVTNSVIERISCKIEADDLEFDQEVICEYLSDNGVISEIVGGTQYTAYYSYSLPILQYSENDEAYIDICGEDSAAHVLKEGGLLSLHAALAFAALEQDVTDRLNRYLESIDFDLDDEAEV